MTSAANAPWWSLSKRRPKILCQWHLNLNAFRLKVWKERPFKLRLSIITGDRPVLVLRIIQLEAVQEEMANEFRDPFVEKFKDSKVETFIGTFTAWFHYCKNALGGIYGNVINSIITGWWELPFTRIQRGAAHIKWENKMSFIKTFSGKHFIMTR